MSSPELRQGTNNTKVTGMEDSPSNSKLEQCTKVNRALRKNQCSEYGSAANEHKQQINLTIL